MRISSFISLCLLFLPWMSLAQSEETQLDTLRSSVVSSRQPSAYLSRGDLQLEVITAAGLQRMACCNVAESFENSASVTVGYSDAATGARQIRLLGLSGIYTQMLDESRPIMRGIAAPFGLTYMPGAWLESIQVAKGATSVTSGIESMTGQINLEQRKPTDEKPLYLNFIAMSDSRLNLDLLSSLQLNDRLSTAILTHVDGNLKTFDMNDDGFVDDPKSLQINVSNRWFYYDPRFQLRWGFQLLNDRRQGGDEAYEREAPLTAPYHWGTEIHNRSIGAYFKLGIPLRADGSESLALMTDYNHYRMDGGFGPSSYDAGQHSAFVKLVWRNQWSPSHDMTWGISGHWDRLGEDLDRRVWMQHLLLDRAQNFRDIGLYGEYTFHWDDKISTILGARAQWYTHNGWKFVPRFTLKYLPFEALTLRLNAGRGLRRSLPLADQIGVFSNGKQWEGQYDAHILEDAWTFGGNLSYRLPIGANPDQAYISLDYFRTQFASQQLVDYETGPDVIAFYSLGDRLSTSDTYQLDFSMEPIERLSLGITARYTDARLGMLDGRVRERAMTGRFKAVLNLQYRARMDRWIFDATAALNGSARVYDFMLDLTDEQGQLLYPHGRTPVYPGLYAQLTRRFPGFDIYLGAENITHFRQKHVLVGPKGENGRINSLAPTFDASAVWGPLMGARIEVGLRLTIWKTY